jgi:hypothetical protein
MRRIAPERRLGRKEGKGKEAVGINKLQTEYIYHIKLSDPSSENFSVHPNRVYTRT